MSPLREMIVASTVSATSNPGTRLRWNASVKMYEPAWISVIRGLAPVMSQVPRPPAATISVARPFRRRHRRPRAARRSPPSPSRSARHGPARACSGPRSRAAPAASARRCRSTCAPSSTRLGDRADARPVQAHIDLDQDADLAPRSAAASASSSALARLSTATITRPSPASRASSAALIGPIAWLAISTSERPASIIAAASQIVAVVSPIAPASSCIRPRIGLLWILACGRSAAGRPAMRRAISAMFRSTACRSRMRAGVAGSSRARPIIWRAFCSRSTQVTLLGKLPGITLRALRAGGPPPRRSRAVPR